MAPDRQELEKCFPKNKFSHAVAPSESSSALAQLYKRTSFVISIDDVKVDYDLIYTYG